jgi:hypothetical protein
MSQLAIKKYISKPSEVEAIQVTKENMADVAKWCAGEIVKDKEGQPFIKVKVWRAQSEKLTQGYAGFWILRRGTGFKVYTDKAFKSSYTDGASIPMAESDPTVEPALFNGMLQELSQARETHIRVGKNEASVSSPPAGVPMRGFAKPTNPSTAVVFQGVKYESPADIPVAKYPGTE